MDVAAALDPPLLTSNGTEKGFLRYSAIQQRFVFLSTNCLATKKFFNMKIPCLKSLRVKRYYTRVSF